MVIFYNNIIIFVTDNNGKTISTLSFIILPGNEMNIFIGLQKNSEID